MRFTKRVLQQKQGRFHMGTPFLLSRTHMLPKKGVAAGAHTGYNKGEGEGNPAADESTAPAWACCGKREEMRYGKVRDRSH